MEPTLPVDTHYLVNRWVYYVRSPKRGDIIVFKSPVDQEKGLIKRVIGIPGDHVEIRSKQIYLNGHYLSEPYTIHKRPDERLVGDNIAPPSVPPGRVFVLGDNRDESEDSSVWKDPRDGEHIYFVNEKDIEGRPAPHFTDQRSLEAPWQMVSGINQKGVGYVGGIGTIVRSPARIIE